MTERREIMQIVEDCERYWLETRVPRNAVADMKAELVAHLTAADAEGKPPEMVVGPDLAEFAEEWASVHRGPGGASWDDVAAGAPGGRSRWIDMSVAGGIVAVFLIGWLAGPKEETVDADIWLWIWVGGAVVLGVAEMITAGFFMLPFAVGAGASALLALLGVNPAVQLLVFAVVSILAFIGLQRFARRQDAEQPAVGANRFINKNATVIGAIDRISGDGYVRLETEEWRATTDGDPIPEGTEVRIIEVRGTRLVVEPAD